MWRQLYPGRKSWWALSHTHAVDQGLRNAYFAKRGLIFLVDLHRRAHQHIVAPDRHNWRCGDDSRSNNRPAAGFITRRPEEPYTNSVRTVLWEPGRATAPATRGALGGGPVRSVSIRWVSFSAGVRLERLSGPVVQFAGDLVEALLGE